MMLTLPPEMLEAVFDSVDDKQVLLNVLVASRQFLQLAERFLYARIVFPPSFLKSTTMKLRRLHEALEASDRRRASYVRTLSLTAQGNEDRILIVELLMKTVNLKDLRLTISPLLISRFFRQSFPFALTSLHIASSRTVRTMSYSSLYPDLLHFLELQTSLEMLHLSHINLNMDVEFPPASFPNLKTLILDSVRVHPFADTAACITHLCMTGVRNSAHADNRCMESVRTLSCPTTHSARSMASWLPNLEWLEFWGPISTSTLKNWHPGNHCRPRGIRLPQFTSGPLHEFRAAFDDIPTLEFVEYGNRGSTLLRRRYRDATAPVAFPSLPKLATIPPPSLQFDTHFLRDELDLFVPIIRGYRTETEHRRPCVETAPSSPEIYPQTPPSCSWPDPPSPCFQNACLFDFAPELGAGDGVVYICDIVRGDGMKAPTRTVLSHSESKPVIEAQALPTPQPRIPKTIGSRKWRYEQRRAQRVMEEEGTITATARTPLDSSSPIPIVGSSATVASEMKNKPTAPNRHTQARVEYRERSHSGAKTAVLNPALSESSFALSFAR
ncbi:hypothetical protein PC9H_001892 [Pleurotus ostreatus]|uniref:F-box domain-containing protein n=1 Tax=Pleurotus ostreatus TaxID=5322 RepID=A0A8H6ZHI4_PLEOS|nr:uncharacterized protein PC9H_001892 [Pleurotus ostreatus]KAF7419305.1 hypothetical protein PC9H_001892 [Pleurotus ostreatus]